MAVASLFFTCSEGSRWQMAKSPGPNAPNACRHHLLPVVLAAFRHVVLCVTLALLGGCASRMYSGPALPRSDIAVIHDRGGLIAGIDNDSVTTFVGRRYEVQPGPRRVTIATEMGGGSGVGSYPSFPRKSLSCAAAFSAEAGKDYWVEGSWSRFFVAYFTGKYQVSVVDQQGKVVASCQARGAF